MELLTGDPEMEEEQEARFAKETAAAVEDAIAISADSVWRLAMDLLLCLLLLSVFFFLLLLLLLSSSFLSPGDDVEFCFDLVWHIKFMFNFWIRVSLFLLVHPIHVTEPFHTHE